MFSVNNFYAVFNSHYCWPRKNNNIWVFAPHGSKDWTDINRFGIHHPAVNNGAIIMHDQEPFFVKSLLALQADLLTQPAKGKDWCAHRYVTANQEFIKTISPSNTLSYYIRSTAVPIFCHSEKNSKDIAYRSDNNYIPCYYWWHGMVARDWFRHWERYAGLDVYNKATAQHRFVFYCRATDGTRAYRTKVKDALQNFSVLGSADNISPDSSATISVDDANNSAIHIVAETLFNTEKIYLTEKVFKPMVMSQPFILFAAPKSLQYLRNYGFKTFSDFWDESYDAITDAKKRKAAVLKLITELQSLSQSEFAELYEQVLPIINYNRKYFYSQEFQDLLWHELTTNMDQALAEQHSLNQQWPGGTDFYHYAAMMEMGIALKDDQVTQMRNTVEHELTKKDWVLRRYPVFQDLL